MRSLLLLAAVLLAAPLAAQTWTNADVRGYGFVNGLLADETTQTVYARTDVGGLFRWDGSRWTGLLDGALRLERRLAASVESFALDPQAPGRIWAALGDGAPGRVVRSDDDGATWTVTGFPGGITMAGNGSWRRAGERLAVDPNNSDVVYFGSRLDGLLRTDDGGASWTTVASFPVVGDDGGPDDGPCAEPSGDGCGPGGLTFVVFDDRSTTQRGGETVTANVYVGALGSGVWRSADGGQTWALAVPGPDTRDNPMRAEFAHGRLQVAMTADGGVNGDGALFAYAPNATGSGGTVTDKTPPTGCPIYGTYAWNTIAAHPTDPDLVVALPFGVSVRKVFFTRNFTDATPTWEIQTDEGPYPACESQQLDYVISVPPWAEPEDGAYSYAGAALFDPADPDQLWVTNGWGAYRFDDLLQDGTTLRLVEVMEGLEELCVPDVAAPGGAGPAFYTAVYDAFGFPHTSADQMPTTTVEKGRQQNGTDIATTPADPLTAAIVGARNNGYVPASRITRDGGQTWADLPGLGNPTDPNDACTAFLTAGNIAISATDADRMVWSPQGAIWPACTGYSERVVTQPHVTADAGQTWTPVAGMDIPGGNFAAGTDFVVSQHLVADAVDGDRFYAYVWPRDIDATAQVWTSNDGGASFEQACVGCLPSFRFPRLQAHPERAGEVWAVFRKTVDDTQADLYRTTDAGSTWNQVTTADSVWAFGFGAPLASGDPATVYAHALVGGVEGVFYSTDDAATWTRFAGTADVPIGVFEGMIGDPDEPGVLYAGSSCRGTWVGDLGLEADTRLTLDGPEGWTPLAAAATSTTVGTLLDGLWTQGFSGSDAPGGAPTVVTYDPSASSRFVPVTSGAQTLEAGDGLFVYVFGDDDPTATGVQGGFPKTLAVPGVEPALPFSVPDLSYVDTGDPGTGGFNLVGNPVDADLDWDASGWVKTALSNVVYLYDPALGEYRTWNGTAGTLTDGVIPAGRAFFVQATGASPALSIPAAARVTSASQTASETDARVVELRLTGEAADGERGASVFVALGVEGATDGLDAFDAHALQPLADAHVAASLASGFAVLSTDARPGVGSVEVPLAARAAGLASSTLTWRWPQTSGLRATLLDRETGTEVDLSDAERYTFDLASTPTETPALALQAAPMATRFVLRIEAGAAVAAGDALPTEVDVAPPAPNPTPDGVRLALALPQAADVEVAVYDLVGRRVLARTLEGLGAGRRTLDLDVSDLAAGVYAVRAQVQDGATHVFTHTLTVVR